jgi:hypothetical protein
MPCDRQRNPLSTTQASQSGDQLKEWGRDESTPQNAKGRREFELSTKRAPAFTALVQTGGIADSLGMSC